jgi:hypothetical protein
MSTESNDGPQPLPERPNLRHLKDQAGDLVKAGRATSLAAAQFQIAASTGLRAGPSSKLMSSHLRRSRNSKGRSIPTTSRVSRR